MVANFAQFFEFKDARYIAKEIMIASTHFKNSSANNRFAANMKRTLTITFATLGWFAVITQYII